MNRVINLSPSENVIDGGFADNDTVLVKCDATDEAFSFIMPSAVDLNNVVFVVKKIDSSSNLVTIEFNGAETLDGSTSKTLPEQYDSVSVIGDYNVYFEHGAIGSNVIDDCIKKDGSTPLTSNWDAGSFKITAEQFESDVVAGTPPFIVASTDVVTNLNADLWDGKQFVDYLDQAVKTTSDVIHNELTLTDDCNFSDVLGSVYGATNKGKVYSDATDLIIDPDFSGSGMVKIGASGEDYLHCGKLGVGYRPDANANIYNINLSLNTNKSFRGCYNIQTKTAGASNSSDSYYADQSLMIIDQAGGTVGPTYCHNIEARLTDGNIVGTLASGSYVVRMDAGTVTGPVGALIFSTDLRTGTIDGSVYGVFANAYVSNGLAQITGDVYGHFVRIDCNTDPDGLAYGLYIQDLSNVDYGVYQENTAPNRLGGALRIESDIEGLEFGVGKDAKINYNATDLLVNPKVVGDGVVLLDTNSKVCYRDSETGIYSQADGYLDLFADTAMRFGNSSSGAPTNYTSIDSGGKVVFVGDAGLAYGEISAESNATATTIAVAGTPVQVTIFDTNGEYSNTTPDHTNDHITITKAGVYSIVVSATINSIAGVGSKLEIMCKKNNGASDILVHMDRNVGGGGSESGVISMSGAARLAVNDTVEIWIENETNTQNYVVEDISLFLSQVGG